MMSFKGHKFNKLTILEDGADKDKVLVLCECGNNKRVRRGAVVRGAIKSCGCLQPKHGMSNSPTYISWASIKQRCGKNPRYLDVTYDPGWDDFVVFHEEMKTSPGVGYSIDKDLFGNGSKHYSKDTCVWMTLTDNTRLSMAMRWGQPEVIEELRVKYEPLRPIHN